MASRSDLVPLASIREMLQEAAPLAQVWVLGGNVLTLAPFGFLLPFMSPRLATWGRMAMAALFFPLAIELSQLAVSVAIGYSYRVTELDDVLLNFAGVLLGYAAFLVARRFVGAPSSAAMAPPTAEPGSGRRRAVGRVD